MSLTRLIIVPALGLLLGGAGGVGAQIGPNEDPLDRIRSDNDLTPTTRPVNYASEEGDFEVVFPGGCAKIRTRIPNSFRDDDQKVVHAFCDRDGREGEGCSVTAWLNVRTPAGGPPRPTNVIDRIQQMLNQFGVQASRQKPIRYETEYGALIEGVDVLADNPDGSGQVWVRGLLVEGDIYLLTAWRAAGPLAEDQDFIAFFGSFRAHTL